MTNALYFGDNLHVLHVLREHIATDSVDLVYLDPPFNSNANYNILFKSPDGGSSESQIEAFEDTWHWNDSAESAFDEVMRSGNTDAFTLLRAMRDFLGDNDMMAYLAMMAVRLIELHRVLKPTGSLYLHCDPTASHYLKLLLDGVFGATNYRNEIVWKRKAGRGETNNAAVRFGVSHDILLFYAKSPATSFVRQYRPNSADYISSKFTHVDETGRRYRLDNLTSPSHRPNLIYEYKGYLPPEKGWAVSLVRMKEMEAEGRVHFPNSKDKRLQRKRFLDELEGKRSIPCGTTFLLSIPKRKNASAIPRRNRSRCSNASSPPPPTRAMLCSIRSAVAVRQSMRRSDWGGNGSGSTLLTSPSG